MTGSVCNSHQFVSYSSISIQAARTLAFVADGFSIADSKICQLNGLIAFGLESVFTPIGESLHTAAKKTAAFIKNNWKPLLSYVLAWGLIVSCTGLMYGFKAVALPLTIGIGCGLAFGIITGILTVKVFDPDGKITLWNLLNQMIERLDPNGTRQIVLAIAVTVLLAASIVFPYVMGAVFGIMIGNQISTKAGSDQNLGSPPEKDIKARENLKDNMSAMQQKIDLLQSRLESIESAPEKKKLALELGKMLHSLKKMQSSLKKLYPKNGS